MERYIKILALLVSIMVWSIYTKGQDTTTCLQDLNPEIKQKFNQAVKKKNYDRNKASQLLLDVVSKRPKCAAAYYHLGEINYKYGKLIVSHSGDTARAKSYFNNVITYFNKVLSLCPSYHDYYSYYYLGIYYFDNEQYDSAKKNLRAFVDNNSTDYESIKLSQNYLDSIHTYNKLINNPVPFNPKPVKSICTDNDEYLPFLSPDKKYLFFTRRPRNFGFFAKSEKGPEHLMISEKKDEPGQEHFSAPKKMPDPFNDLYDQGGGAITIDNKTLYITMCKPRRSRYSSYKNCDIYCTEKEKDGWGELQRLSDKINGVSSWEAQPTITSDGKVLLFASSRKGGYGGIDIYRSVKDSNGNWSEAKNLGPVINTAAHDKTPFMHPDNKTLYFSSNGHFGLGGFDIFMSRYQGNGKWSQPKNIGYPINTENDEVGFVISTDGEEMYFSSNEIGDSTSWNIYKATLPRDVRPDSVLLIKGKLVNKHGNPIKDATVELQNTRTLKITRALVDSITGKYAVATPVEKGDEFILTAKQDSFVFSTKYIRPNEQNMNKSPEIDFVLKDVEVGTRIKLKNIYFEFNSAEFNEISRVTLRHLLKFLKINPEVEIALYGHTDSIGSKKSNLKLSQERAKAVHDYLIKHGISSDRLSYKGFGENKPIATNSTRKGRAKNRRTEFVITVK